VEFTLPKIAHRASDNYVDLFPGIPHRIQITTTKPTTVNELMKRLSTMSLADTYQ
jgi:hypothetical protein